MIPPEVTQTVQEQIKVYEVPEKMMNRVFGESIEQHGKTLEQMRRQSGCETAEWGSAADQSLAKYGKPIRVCGSPKQVTAFGNCLEMGLMAANSTYKIDKWRRMQQQIHMER